MAHVGAEHASLLGKIMTLAPKLALEQGCNPYPEGGFRIVTNTGPREGRRCIISTSMSWVVRGLGCGGDT